ncbi:nyctalopin isoform X1 [Chiloscyllium plagiosum]|uniref:nyctalopin isoform X1 n=1 Tax=Chiloscyllium plagiosum TaxID=36176 RepID=UPI001CB874F4|nr:nyctalopin isoform X1 [Chiloscyllium plagiosum]
MCSSLPIWTTSSGQEVAMKAICPKMNVVLFVTLRASAPWACSRLCPTVCTCSAERNCVVLCDRAGLQQVLSEFPCEASLISLEKNNIKFLSEKAFGTLPALRSLSLNHNNISFITPGAFKGLPHLSELQLAHNEFIKYLHTRTFTNLKRLKKLDLSNCNLFNIPDRIFVAVPSLQELAMWQNNFRRIPAAVRATETLRLLYLERNRIEAVAYNSLQGLRRLKYLNLQNNKIAVIHEKGFKDCVELEYLYLNDNLLRNLPEFAFQELRLLKMLNLGGNALVNVSSTWFSQLVELEVLYLDRNAISYIEEGTFENLTSLISLHLNSNNLTSLPFSVFQPVYFLGRLYVFRNPWGCDCKMEWLKEWMENYKLVRDIPCASPPSVAGMDLSQVLFPKSSEGTCVDPVQQNETVYTPIPTQRARSTADNRFSNLISKLLFPKMYEDAENTTEIFRNVSVPGGVNRETSTAVTINSNLDPHIQVVFIPIIMLCYNI